MKQRLSPTERSNPRTARIDRVSTRRAVELLQAEDARVPAAVRKERRQIVRAVDAIVRSWRAGGRLFYVGAGTSGRLGVLDAAECPPTFQVPPRRMQAVIAGGRAAMFRSAEGAEDSPSAGARDLARRRARRGDVVVILTASGTTPYALGAVRWARRRGITTVAVTSHRRSPAARAATIAICPDTGPEAIAGSTRLKAGTAQKLILNLLSTAAMIRLGHVYRNLMVNVQMTNRKLRARGRRILIQVLDVTPAQAGRLIRQSGGNLKAAILMGRLHCTRREAIRRLQHAQGNVARALGEG